MPISRRLTSGSRVSLISSRTSPYGTLSLASSSSSSSTVWRPGALTGKALKAIGDATLRGVEIVVIRRRLSVISSHFPHDDSKAIKNIDRMYDDLLELSWRGLYTMKTRQRALSILAPQVSRGQTGRLMCSLAKWPYIETRLFAYEFLNHVLQPGDRGGLPLLRLVSSPTSKPMATLAFLCGMALLNEQTCQLLVNMGFLDAILCLLLDGASWRLGTRHLPCSAYYLYRCLPQITACHCTALTADTVAIYEPILLSACCGAATFRGARPQTAGGMAETYRQRGAGKAASRRNYTRVPRYAHRRCKAIRSVH